MSIGDAAEDGDRALGMSKSVRDVEAMAQHIEGTFCMQEFWMSRREPSWLWQRLFVLISGLELHHSNRGLDQRAQAVPATSGELRTQEVKLCSNLKIIQISAIPKICSRDDFAELRRGS